MNTKLQWFHRLADVPGLHLPEPPLWVASNVLPGHDAVPKTITVYTADGEAHLALDWLTAGGLSPARKHAFAVLVDSDHTPSHSILQHVCEALELPGEPSDYHIIVQTGIQTLSQSARPQADLTVLPAVEWLCRLDIQLIEAFPSTITYERDGESQFYRVIAFEKLAQWYEREGFLRDALDIAERGSRFGMLMSQRDRLRERVAQLEAEDVP